MSRVLVLSSLIAAGALSAAAAGQQQQQAPLPDLQKVKENLYYIGGASPGDRSMFTGGNTGVFVTDAGVVVVDTKLAGYGPSILQKIRAVTDKPVTTIINTHTHGDHVGSNAGFPASVEIVAHENTKANMLKMDAFKDESAPGLPDRTYKDTLTIGSGKDRVELYYFGAGHTNGDTFIVYPALRVLQTGDMFPWKDAPFIDLNNGGSGVQYPQTLAKLIATVKDIDTVIPGHIAPTTPADLQEFQRFTADLLAAVQQARKSGQTAEAAAAAIDLTSKYKEYKSERVKAAIDAIYKELSQ
jgi:cyclase